MDFGNVCVGQQDHDQIGNLDCFSHFLNLQAGVCRLVPGGAAFAQADDHIDAGFVQVERVRVALRAVTDDGNSFALDQGQVTIRSEEHTSELQSLMRISSAVFCLTKQTNTN